MTLQTIEEAFKYKVCESVFLLPEGVNRYRVFAPFLFDDGDHLVIVLKKELDRWVLSDEGHTFMRLTETPHRLPLKLFAMDPQRHIP